MDRQSRIRLHPALFLRGILSDHPSPFIQKQGPTAPILTILADESRIPVGIPAPLAVQSVTNLFLQTTFIVIGKFHAVVPAIS